MKWWQRIPYTWRLAFGLWLGMRLLLWALSAFMYYRGLLPSSPFPQAPVALDQGLAGALFGSWLRWDGGFYYLILTQGYAATPSLSAFLPLYTILAKPLFLIGGNPLIALLFISNLAFLPAIVLFLEEVRTLLGPEKLLSAGTILMVFPGAFFFFAPFPQSLAFLLIMLTWRFTRQQKWFGAAIAGLLCGLTHPTVIPLVILLFGSVVSWMKKSIGRLRWIVLSVPAMPLAGFALFLAWRERQGFLPYIEYQSQVWGMSVFNPWAGIKQLFQSMMDGNLISDIKFFLLIVGIFSLIWLFKNRYFILGFYQASLIGFLISFTMPIHPFGSFIRYNLISFPTFFALAALLSKNRWLYAISSLGMGIVNIFLSILYLSWYFVA